MAPPYDEFGMLRDNAEEVGLAWTGPPPVVRRAVELPDGRRLSALVWGDGPPEAVLLHGGAQNAHTWDTVALALGRPLVAFDLPGHGHSGWRDDHRYLPPSMAEDVAVAMADLAPAARLVVGMSMGGLTACCLAAAHPDRVGRLVVVDVTPGVDREKASPIAAFISGPEVFATFDEILARTVQYNPTRSESSLRRGILHNAYERPDGTWSWRYDRLHPPAAEGAPEETPEETPAVDFSELWQAVDGIRCPVMLVRGALSGVVGDEDVEEFLRRQPSARVVVVDGAGHSIQGDKPLDLARLLGGELSA